MKTNKEKHYSEHFIRKVNKYIQYGKIILPFIFFGILIVGLLVSLIIPLRPSFSEAEKRELAKFPHFSFSALIDGSFFKGVDLWYSDTFPFREKMISVNSFLEEMRGFGDRIYGLNDNVDSFVPPEANTSNEENTSSAQTEQTEQTEPDIPDQSNMPTQTLSNIIVIGNAGYEYCSFVQSIADKYVSAVNKTASELDGFSKVYVMLAPTSIDITVSDSVRKKINSTDQSVAMDYIYGSLNSKAKAVNVYKPLRMHRDKYIYYRTDHHWTALGAFYAYCEYAKAAGFKSLNLTKNYTKESYGDFLGSFYSNTNNNEMKKTPDELIAYVPKYQTKLQYTTTSGKTYDWDLVHNVSDYVISQKYSAFAAGDNPFTKIDNLSKETGKTCLVIKESFGNAVIPFIVGNYKKVYVIDYRYYKSGFVTFAKNHKVDDVLFINNMSAVRNAPLMDKLSALAN